MPTPKQINAQIVDLIARTIEDFVSDTEKDSKRIFSRLQTALKDIDLTADGRIKPTLANQKIFKRIEAQLGKDILTPAYLKRLETFTAGFDKVGALQALMFKELGHTVKDTQLLKLLRNNAIELTVSSLTEAGINQALIKPIRQQLTQSLASGGQWSDLVDNLRAFIITDNQNLGGLQRHIGTIATDTLNQYHATRLQATGDGLGFEFYLYDVGIKDTTRDFCKTRSGNIYHISEIAKWPSQAGPWPGMIPGTNASNIRTNRGGYNCRHQFRPVATSEVSKAKRAEFGLIDGGGTTAEPVINLKGWSKAEGEKAKGALSSFMKENGMTQPITLIRTNTRSGSSGFVQRATKPEVLNGEKVWKFKQEITLNGKIDKSSIDGIINHEARHLLQETKNGFIEKSDGTYWEGKKIVTAKEFRGINNRMKSKDPVNSLKAYIEYRKLPWEADAWLENTKAVDYESISTLEKRLEELTKKKKEWLRLKREQSKNK